ncbi:MAG TPA: 4Fe-4S double cluster binding domain-containing protein [Spirochaetota bacterium]|nr:4Fe-4S double cluster binding domain-containing protein [Spirochaetota bacterium]
MLTREHIIEEAHRLGFVDIGFTTAEPFDSHLECLEKNREAYEWAPKLGLDLFKGTDPRTGMPEAKSIIVLIEAYYRESFPSSLEGHFGRCYLDDDRVTRDGLTVRMKAFRSFLKENGVASKAPFDIPHRMAAARAGTGTFGKNCLLYSNKAVRGSSWILPLAFLVDREFSPDRPTVGIDCPSWCRNACIAACPTRALKGDGTIDPRRCISYLSYFGDGITPVELREPMGMYIYGCDRCQNVCPRNAAWSAQELPPNPRVAAKSKDFDLVALLHMDRAHFERRIWPHMFYMSADDLWRWKMNVARVMGNSGDTRYTTELARAFGETGDLRVRGMIAWALGRIGGGEARAALERLHPAEDGPVRAEFVAALGAIR